MNNINEDPLVMYLVVRESLNMGAGKVGAQCGHAVQLIMLEWLKLHMATANLNEKEKNQYNKFNDWMNKKTNGSFRKVVLRADDKEWEKIKKELDHILVTDAGLTEVLAGSETCIALFPMKKSERPKVIKRLQTL